MPSQINYASSFILVNLFLVIDIIGINSFNPSVSEVYKNVYTHAKLVLYQGTDKFKLDAKDCAVGISFEQGERFSCACINGIWAFYNSPCQGPVAIVGGINHCFQMPPYLIKMITVIGNPLRASGEFLTVFDRNMDVTRTKIYRNTRIHMTDSDKFISLNSNWTLTSPDGSESVCLDSQTVTVPDEGLTRRQLASMSNATYCSFSNLKSIISVIGNVRRGCNATVKIQPSNCQPMLPANLDQDVCMSDQVLKEYQDMVLAKPVQDGITYEPNLNETFTRTTMNNLGHFFDENKTLFGSKGNTESGTTEKIALAYLGEPEWHRRLPPPSINSTKSTSSDAVNSIPVPKIVDFTKMWNNPKNFLSPPASSSNIIILNQFWMHKRLQIREALNISRMVPPDIDWGMHVGSGKVKKLLVLHKEIMKQVCPLLTSSFLDSVVGTFIGVLTKVTRWKEPPVRQTDYLRILSALFSCQKRAVSLRFSKSTSCNDQNIHYVEQHAFDSEDTVLVPLEVPDVFRTMSYEPVIEAIWKIFITVHSYCFSHFAGQLRDHHQYTLVMTELFSNNLHDIWVRNNTLPIEYMGVLGDTRKIMEHLESCATGVRMISDYPYHLNRPTKLFKYGIKIERMQRKRRSLVSRTVGDFDGSSAERDGLKILSRKKRIVVNSVNSPLKLGEEIFAGKGFCMKKYADQKRSTCNKIND